MIPSPETESEGPDSESEDGELPLSDRPLEMAPGASPKAGLLPGHPGEAQSTGRAPERQGPQLPIGR